MSSKAKPSPKFAGSRDPKRSPAAKQQSIVRRAQRAAKRRGA